MNSEKKRKPRIGVFKFASCDGCQLTLLEAEDELLGHSRRGGDRLFSRGQPRHGTRAL